VRIDTERIASILRNLRFGVDASAGVLRCVVPTFRNDIEREVDLAEEIARIYGYDNIPAPEKISLHSSEPYDDEVFINSLRRVALALGFDEVVSSSLIERKQTFGNDGPDIIEVLNPVNAERPCLRPALLPSMLENIERNIRNGAGSLRIFEIGNVFSASNPCESAVFEDIRQEPRIAFAVTGNAEERSWHQEERRFDFFDLKGLIEAFLEKMRLSDKTTMRMGVQQASSSPGLTVEIDGVVCGRLTQISERLSELYSIEQSVYYAEFSVEALRKAPAGEIRYTPVRRYPEVRRDLAFLLKNEVTAGELLASVTAAGVRILNEVQVVDVFRHESFGSDMKSMAVSLTFQASDRTLEDGEISAALTTIVKTIKSLLHAELREV